MNLGVSRQHGQHNWSLMFPINQTLDSHRKPGWQTKCQCVENAGKVRIVYLRHVGHMTLDGFDRRNALEVNAELVSHSRRLVAEANSQDDNSPCQREPVTYSHYFSERRLARWRAWRNASSVADSASPSRFVEGAADLAAGATVVFGGEVFGMALKRNLGRADEVVRVFSRASASAARDLRENSREIQPVRRSRISMRNKTEAATSSHGESST